MPRENIERAIRRGTGEGRESHEEITYEGYGLVGVALMIQSLTDTLRTARWAKFGTCSLKSRQPRGREQRRLDVPRKGQVIVEKGKADEEQLLNAALNAGA